MISAIAKDFALFNKFSLSITPFFNYFRSSAKALPPKGNPLPKNVRLENKSNRFIALLDYIWPIERRELSKFLLLTLLMFCILGIQNLIRAMKDSVINTLIGTETIAFLKFWCVMPSALLITVLYVKLVGVMRSENIFYLIMSTFLAFFALFAFYLFPNHEALHFSPEYSNRLILAFPNFKWFILILSKWSFSLFYIIAELWPNLMFALLFWQFVNQITGIEQSKRFYPLFGLLGQTGLVLSGLFLARLEYIDGYLITSYGLDKSYSELSLQLSISIVSLLGIIALASFRVINRNILDTKVTENLQFKVKKQPLTLKESFKMIIGSRYIMLITVLLICYGVSINLVENSWKATAAKRYPTPTAFAAFVGEYLTYTGIFTILFVLLGSNIVRRLGWFFGAIITPVMVTITGMLFFITANFDSVAALMMFSLAFTDPVTVTIVMGAIQNILSKSTKYSLFDSTKEMSYVPLDGELKTKGKAAADMIGTKLGKSASSFLQSAIFIIIPTATYKSISVFMMIAFLIICCVWIWGVVQLNKEYKTACARAENF